MTDREFITGELRQLAHEFAELQKPLIQGVMQQHEDLRLVVAAVADLQNAVQLLVERLDAVHRPEDGDNWWRGEGESE